MAGVKNFLSTEKQLHDDSHNGRGPYELYEIWGRSDFKSSVDFIDRMVIPAGSTVGYHQHGNNEEMYIVLSGRGTMTINDVPRTIQAGDMILNPAFGSHGLVNDSDAEIDLLVVQISLET